jgi:aspartate kinase
VALAGTLGAEACEILTDVDGVFTADPRVVPTAQKLEKISYEDMIALAEAGAGVLHPSSVRYARDHAVPVHVRSSFTDAAGTWVVASAPEAPMVGIAHRVDDGSATLTLVGSAARGFDPDPTRLLASAGIISEVTEHDDRSVRVELAAEDVAKAVRLLHAAIFEKEVAK